MIFPRNLSRASLSLFSKSFLGFIFLSILVFSHPANASFFGQAKCLFSSIFTSIPCEEKQESDDAVSQSSKPLPISESKSSDESVQSNEEQEKNKNRTNLISSANSYLTESEVKSLINNALSTFTFPINQSVVPQVPYAKPIVSSRTSGGTIDTSNFVTFDALDRQVSALFTSLENTVEVISTSNITEGTNLFYTNARVGDYISASSTLSLSGIITLTGTATSSFSGGVSSVGLASSAGLTLTGGSILSSSSATSTLAGGFNITSGCFAVNGTCVSSSGGSSSQWTTSGSDIYYSTGSVGIGTSTPAKKLSVQGDALISGNLNVANFTATGTVSFTGTGTSTFSGGVSAAGLASSAGLTLTGGSILSTSAATSTLSGGFNIISGCYAINGTCVSGSSGSSQWITSGSDIYYTTGNVGIGTTSPSNRLSVQGNGEFMGSLNVANSITTGNLTATGTINTSGTTGGYRIDNNLVLQASSTNSSTLVGNGAGAALLSDGLYNTAIGYQALNLATSTDQQTAVGYQSLASNITGYDNSAFGYQSLYLNTVGYQNTAIGLQALRSNTTGYYNTAVGFQTLYNNTSGTYNTAVGLQAMISNTSGVNNVAQGFSSLYSNSSGSSNVAMGMYSLYGNSSGAGNVGLGHQALGNNTTGYFNTSIGYQSLYDLNITAGDNSGNNTAIGYNTGRGITTGVNNTIIGANVTGLAATLSNRIIIADGSGNQRIYVDNSGLLGIGTTTPAKTLSVQGNGLFSGDLSVAGLTATGTVSFTGTATSTFGGGVSTAGLASSAGLTLTGGDIFYSSASFRLTKAGRLGIGTANPAQKLDVSGNIALPATVDSTTGVIYKGVSTFIHDFTAPDTDGFNTFVGLSAGNLTMSGEGGQSSRNTAVGQSSFVSNTTGYNDVAIGSNALYTNNSGYKNTAIGAYSLYYLTSGYQNIANGEYSGAFLANGSSPNQTSNNSVYLGYNVMAGANGNTNEIVIGASAIGNGSNSITLGNTSITKTILRSKVGIGTTTPDRALVVSGGTGVVLTSLDNGAGTAYVCTTLASGALSTSTSACNPSSRRLKNNIRDLETGLDDLMKLRPVSFTYKPEMLIGEQNQVGFIAEEIFEIVPESVGFDKDGLPYNVDYSKLTPILTKAVQELDEKVKALSFGSRYTNFNDVLVLFTKFLNDTYDIFIDKGLLRIANIISKKISTDELCVGKICVTEKEFENVFGKGHKPSSGGGGGQTTSSVEPSVVQDETENEKSISSEPEEKQDYIESIKSEN